VVQRAEVALRIDSRRSGELALQCLIDGPVGLHRGERCRMSWISWPKSFVIARCRLAITAASEIV
jgi:hypothetical protein